MVAHESSLRRAGELQQLNVELHYKEEEIRALVNNISDCVITIDAAGTIRSANPAIERVFGRPAHAVGHQLARPVRQRSAMPQDVASSVALGFFRYLTKPLDVDEFFDTLDQTLTLPQHPAPAAPS